MSPGMTIATCAWMEENWLKERPMETKKRFDAMRYMDDIFMAYDTSDRWDSNKLIEDICESKCYWNPLTLEDGRQGVFLEIEYEQKKDPSTGSTYLAHCIKNDNANGQTVWRYHDYRSAAEYSRKRATLLAVLRKTHLAASDGKMLYKSALHKLKEFKELGYPSGIRKFACAIMARDYCDLTWRTVRRFQ